MPTDHSDLERIEPMLSAVKAFLHDLLTDKGDPGRHQEMLRFGPPGPWFGGWFEATRLRWGVGVATFQLQRDQETPNAETDDCWLRRSCTRTRVFDDDGSEGACHGHPAGDRYPPGPPGQSHRSSRQLKLKQIRTDDSA
jgi:hypothetical protein